MAKFFQIESGEFTVAGNPTTDQVREQSDSSWRGMLRFIRILFGVFSDIRKK